MFSASESFDSTYQTNVVVTSSGLCTYIPPGMFKSSCPIDITWFPFDDQSCEMKFGSWTYNGFKVCIMVLVLLVLGWNWEFPAVTMMAWSNIYVVQFHNKVILPLSGGKTKCGNSSGWSLLLFVIMEHNREQPRNCLVRNLVQDEIKYNF